MAVYIRLLGFRSRGSDIRLKQYTRLLAFGLRRRHTRLKNIRQFFFYGFTMFS